MIRWAVLTKPRGEKKWWSESEVAKRLAPTHTLEMENLVGNATLL